MEVQKAWNSKTVLKKTRKHTLRHFKIYYIVMIVIKTRVFGA